MEIFHVMQSDMTNQMRCVKHYGNTIGFDDSDIIFPWNMLPKLGVYPHFWAKPHGY